jgi:Ni/Fe-hydrogenase subunit HybB-like protein
VDIVALVALPVAIGATAYTGLLFAQGLARDLWQGPHATIDLIAQAIAEGAAVMLVVAMAIDAGAGTVRVLGLTLAWAALAHVGILALEHFVTPSPTVQHELAVRVIRHGVFRRLFLFGAIGLGGLVPIAFVWLASLFGFTLILLVPTALMALAGSLAWEYIWVEAGQAVPNS